MAEIPFKTKFARSGNLRFKQFVSDDSTSGTEVFKLFTYVIIINSVDIGYDVKRFPCVKLNDGSNWMGVE